jgi:hypothetical protein
MEEITIKAYKASELSKGAQELLATEYEDINLRIDREWDSPLIEGIKEELALYGIEDPEITWSGFYSQGDGLSFTFDLIDTDIFIRKLYEEGHITDENTVIESKNMHVFSRRATHRYCHEKSVLFGVNYEGTDNIDISQLTNRINIWKENRCRIFYSQLEKQYEELSTIENIIGTLDETGFLFTASGKRIYTQ